MEDPNIVIVQFDVRASGNFKLGEREFCYVQRNRIRRRFNINKCRSKDQNRPENAFPKKTSFRYVF